jgi:hypothetical protein
MTFPETELRAYEGAYLDYDAMPPAKYKYFARIAGLGRDVRAGRKTPNEAATARNEYLEEYNRTMEKMSWPDIIKLTESCRVCVNGSNDPAYIAALTLRVLRDITGDMMLDKKMREMERLVNDE